MNLTARAPSRTIIGLTEATTRGPTTVAKGAASSQWRDRAVSDFGESTIARPHRLRAILLTVVALALLMVAAPAAARDPIAPSGDDVPRLDRGDGIGGIGTNVVVPGEIIPPDFSEEVIYSGIQQPIVVDFAPDGRVFLGLKDGRILVHDDLDDTTGTVWADLRTQVHDYWDRGLLGMALDPAFATNGRIYVSYTYNAPPGETAPHWSDGTCPNPPNGPGGNTDGCVVTGRVSALTSGQPEQVLVHDWCQQFPSHSMSDIVFDAEGALIVNGGDGASFSNTDYGQWGGSIGSPTPKNPCGDPPSGVGGTQTIPTAEGGALRSQDLRGTGDPVGLGGAIIRINKMTGAPMADNPGIGASSTNEQRIIGYGLRNPFRMAVHPVTGELWLGDVGWSTWEEINRHSDVDGVIRNYGWPCREGASLQPGAYNELDLCSSMTSWTAPHFTYNHNSEVVSGDGCETGGGSISGMAFYPGGSYPDTYDNALFWTDYTRDCMWVLPAGAGGLPDGSARAHFAILEDPVHLAIGPNNDLFYVDIGAGSNDGSLRRIRYTPANSPPDARVSATPTSGSVPLAVSFNAGASTDPDGNALTYAWDFDEDGDGQFNDATGVTANNTYDAPGTYVARVRVTDIHGASDTASVTINASNQAPTASITQPTTSLTWSVGDTIAFSGTATDPNGSIPAANFTWQVVINHCPSSCHEHVIATIAGVKSGTFDAPDHEYPSTLAIRLHVEDQHGADDDASVVINPKTVTIQVGSSPAGVTLTSGWVTKQAPFSMTAIRGSLIELTAPTGVTIGGYPYTFSSWSDGGARSHSFTANSSTSVTATFSGGYADVPQSSPYYLDVGWLVQEGITTGCSTNPPLFCPTSPVTRGQMASFLVRALDLEPTSSDAFTDDGTSIHEADINALAAAGLTTGCGDGRYCPNAAVTRAQMASFLVRGFAVAPSGTDAFTDDETSMHEADINALAAAGITTGCTPTTFCPLDPVSRQQMAAFLHRAMSPS